MMSKNLSYSRECGPYTEEQISHEVGVLEDQIDRLRLLSYEASNLVCQLLQEHVQLEEPESLEAQIADCVDDALYHQIQELETEVNSLIYSASDLS